MEKAQQAINYISLAMNRVETFSMPSYKQATIEVFLNIHYGILNIDLTKMLGC